MTSAARIRLLAGAVLVTLAAGGGVAYSQVIVDHTDPGAAATDSATPSAGPTTVEPVQAVPTTTTTTTSARAAATRSTAAPTVPVDTDPPAVVATDPPTVASGGNVEVVVTSADWDAASSSVQASAYVSGAVEADGSCTLTLTSGSRRATAEVDAVPDATTTSCGLIAVPRSQVTAGTWKAVVSYSSPRSSGTSAPATVVVP